MTWFKRIRDTLKSVSKNCVQILKKFIGNFTAGSKKKVFIQILILLIAINGLFWGYRMIRHQYTISEQKKEYEEVDEKPINNWRVDLDEDLEIDKSNKKSTNQETEEDKLENIQEETKEKSETLSVKSTVKEGSVNIKSNAVESDNHQKESKAVLATMAAPVFGQVITRHSVDTLVYSKTLEQWYAHCGIDIKAKIGSHVKSAINGVVESVALDDPRFGVLVTIDHGNELKTVYGNLAEAVPVRKGDMVKKGQVIGQVGKSAPFEIEDPPHLHFEVLKNGKSIDPQQFLPKLN